MKSNHLLATIFALLFAGATAFAQIPRTVTYQGILTDASGTFIPDGSHNLTLNIYSAATGGAALYTEAQPAVVVKGLFNVIIGSVNPIPPSLAFDRAYFLGVSVDGGTELAPRTPMTAAPYALRAAVADKAMALDPSVTGVVTSVNGLSGAVTLQGGGGTTVNQSGNTVTISSSGGGGTGIQGVQNTDGSMTISNPNGPTATVNLANGGVTNLKISPDAIASANIVDGAVNTADLAAGAVTAVKVGSGVVANGHVLTANGSGGATWQPATSGLTLPYSGTANVGTGASFVVNNTANSGSEYGVHGIINNTAAGGVSAGVRGENRSTTGNGIGVYGSQAGSGWGVYGTTPTGWGVYGGSTGTGTGVVGISTSGRAGDFSISTAANSSIALRASTAGTGRAGEFTITNTTSSATALVGKTASTDNAAIGVYGEVTTAPAGPSNIAAGVKGYVGAGSGVGQGVWGDHAGGGTGVSGTSDVANGSGVFARGAGYGARVTSAAGTALDATTTTGFAGKFASSGATSTNPALAVTGASNAISSMTVTRGLGSGIGGINTASALFVDGDLYGIVGFGGGGSGYAAVLGRGTTTTPGVWGLGSIGVKAESNGTNGTALEVINGFIKVSGTARTAYVHTTTAGNTTGHITNLSYPGMASTDIVVATHSYTAAHMPRVPYSVWWDGSQWAIYLDRGISGTETMPIGEKFNVIIIKQ